MQILIGADICATDDNKRYFTEGKIENILDKKLIKCIEKADYRIFNLEGPLINEGRPISKNGPNLKMPDSCIEGIKRLNPSLLTLANNHIMDYGNDGLNNTVKLLGENQIGYVGIRCNNEDIKKYHIITDDDMSIAIYACAEHEFSIAENGGSGANPYNPIQTNEDIQFLKKIADYVIVLYHGGKECYRYPSPDLQYSFKTMAKSGADLIVAQHTHCVGCYEKYHNSYLIYGQGNFIFNMKKDEYWNSGLLISLTINKEKSDVEFLPFLREGEKICLKLGENEVIKDFIGRSKKITNTNYVDQMYQRYISDNYIEYLMNVKKENIFIKVIRKLGMRNLYNRLYFSESELIAMLNYVECEAHRESLIRAIKFMAHQKNIPMR